MVNCIHDNKKWLFAMWEGKYHRTQKSNTFNAFRRLGFSTDNVVKIYSKDSMSWVSFDENRECIINYYDCCCQFDVHDHKK